MSNLTKRILVGIVGIPAALGLIYLGGWPFSIFIILLTAQALREFYHLGGSKHASPNVGLGVVWSIVTQLAVSRAVIAWPGGTGALAVSVIIMSSIIIGVLLTLLVELFRARENALINTALTAFGVGYITLAMTCVLLLRGLTERHFIGSWGGEGASLVAVMFASVWASDSVAYFVGVKLGKHKLFPRVSPKKSWEGAIGGLIGAVGTFWGLASVLLPALSVETAILCGIVVGVIGPFGDLAESLLKRDAIVKDSGGLLPGHGGVFDRFDSMLFVAPIIAAVVYWDDLIGIFFGS